MYTYTYSDIFVEPIVLIHQTTLSIHNCIRNIKLHKMTTYTLLSINCINTRYIRFCNTKKAFTLRHKKQKQSIA